MTGTFRTVLLGMALLASMVFIACAGGGKVSDLADVGWDESRRDADTRIITLLSQGRYEEVIGIADSIESAEGTDPRLQGQKAEALWRTGSVDEAVALFEESLLADYAVCETHLNFAVLLLETGKTGRALTELNEAKMFCGIENTPVISRNLAVVRIKRGEEAAALTVVDEGLDYAPNDSYLLGLKGMLIAGANPVLAETLFVKSERAGGMTPDFLYQLGLLMLRSSQPSPCCTPAPGSSTTSSTGLASLLPSAPSVASTSEDLSIVATLSGGTCAETGAAGSDDNRRVRWSGVSRGRRGVPSDTSATIRSDSLVPHCARTSPDASQIRLDPTKVVLPSTSHLLADATGTPNSRARSGISSAG